MPKSWFGIGNSSGQNAPSGKSLLAQDIRFLRKVRSIRKPLLSQYTWLGNFHAILKGKTNLDSLNIQAKMADIGGLEDQMKMELLSVQADILSRLADVMAAYNLPKEAWVELIFKRYLRLPDDVVNVFMTALPTPTQAMPMESQDVVESNLRRASEAIRTVLDPDKSRLTIKIKSAMEASEVDNFKQKKYRNASDVLGISSIRQGDSIIVGETRLVAGCDFTAPTDAVNATIKVDKTTLNESQWPKPQNILIKEDGKETVKEKASDHGPPPVFESSAGDEQPWRKYTRLYK
jgi:hypothetical protein